MLPTLLLLLGAYDVTVQPAPAEKSRLDWDKPVACMLLKPSKTVPSGEYRVQCDLTAHTCLAAPNRVLVDGVEGEETLSRVNDSCTSYLDADVIHALEKGEWPLIEAIAEAPPGWYRDERGRVMQVNFDLGRRVFFGGAWAPYYRPDGTGFVPGRARVEFGGSATTNARDDHQQHRFHFLEATLWLGSNPRDLRFEASVLRYDTSSRHERAPLWLTTFVGQPKRFDIPLNFGWGGEAGRFEALGGRTFVTFIELDVTLDLWLSADLDSYLRVRLGPALEYDVEGKGAYLRPTVAVEGDFTLDRDGFHHLTASAVGEKLVFEPADPGRGVSPNRLRVKAGYEVILFALNDYPVTFTLDGRAVWRDDVPALKGWEFSGNAGLRFSLWAPARHLSAPVVARPVRVAPVRVKIPVANPPLEEEETKSEDGLTDTQRLIRAAKRKLEQ
jgi:hypothetical protein